MENKDFSKRKFYNHDDSGKVFLFVILLQVAVSLIISLITNQISSNYEIKLDKITSSVWYMVANGVISIAIYLLLYFFYTKTKKIEYSAIRLNFKMKWHTYFIAIIVGIIALFGIQYFIGAVDKFWSIIGYPLDTSMSNNLTSIGTFFLSVFAQALVPAICEEIIFRGMIFNGLLSRFKTYPAIFISALLFALMHGNLQQLVYTFILGSIMAWIVARTGSIVSSMIVHFTNNFLVILTTFLQNKNILSLNLPNTWWYYLIAVGLLFVTAGIIFLIDRFYFKHKDKEEFEKSNDSPKFVIIAISVGVAVLAVLTIFTFVA